jgi:hypothetical protein
MHSSSNSRIVPGRCCARPWRVCALLPGRQEGSRLAAGQDERDWSDRARGLGRPLRVAHCSAEDDDQQLVSVCVCIIISFSIF